MLFQIVLKEIREWLDVHPKEVVILSFSHFLGLSQELHTLLVSTIKSVFDSKLCPKMVWIHFSCLILEMDNGNNIYLYIYKISSNILSMLYENICLIFLSGSCDITDIMEPGSSSYHFIWAQYCQLPQRIVVPYTLLVGQQVQGWIADRGIWTQKTKWPTR